MENLLTLMIPVVSVVISVLASVIVTMIRNRTELSKIQMELQQKYAKSLFDKRIEVYPELYNLLSGYDKLILYNQQTKESLRKFRDKIDKWNSQYSIFFTIATTRISFRFRGYLRKLLSDEHDLTISDEDWKAIHKIIETFESSLKADIGILDIKPVSELKELKELYEFIDSKREISRELPTLKIYSGNSQNDKLSQTKGKAPKNKNSIST